MCGRASTPSEHDSARRLAWRRQAPRPAPPVPARPRSRNRRTPTGPGERPTRHSPMWRPWREERNSSALVATRRPSPSSRHSNFPPVTTPWVWYFAALCNGFVTGKWEDGTASLVEKGIAREEANTPPAPRIDQAFKNLTAASGKDWLSSYRGRVNRKR